MFEVFESEFSLATFASLSFAFEFMNVYESEDVDLMTLDIAKAFSVSFWKNEEITLEILNELLLDLGTDESIKDRFFQIVKQIRNM